MLRGPLRYPSYSGEWQLGDIDFSEYMAKYRDHEIIVIVASVGKGGTVEKEKNVCGGTCGFAMTDLGEYLRCKMQREETAKGLTERQQREAVFREIDELVEDAWEDAGQLRVVSLLVHYNPQNDKRVLRGVTDHVSDHLVARQALDGDHQAEDVFACCGCAFEDGSGVNLRVSTPARDSFVPASRARAATTIGAFF